MSAIKTVIFDIGRVLLDFDHQRAAMQIASVTGLSLGDIWEHLYESGMEMAYERGAITTPEVIAAIRKLSPPRSFHDKDLLRAAGDIFAPKDDVIALAYALKKKSYRLVLLSNTCEAHWLFFSAAYPVFKLFDAATLSFEVKAMKPEQKIYDDAIAKALCNAGECFYTDDIPEYVAAGRAAGLRAHAFSDAKTLRKDMESEGIRF